MMKIRTLRVGQVRKALGWVIKRRLQGLIRGAGGADKLFVNAWRPKR